jgi:hypothetical protein
VDPPSSCPPRDRLGVDAKERGHLAGGEQALTWVHRSPSSLELPDRAPATGSCWSTGSRSRPLAAGRCPGNGSTNVQPGNRPRGGRLRTRRTTDSSTRRGNVRAGSAAPHPGRTAPRRCGPPASRGGPGRRRATPGRRGRRRPGSGCSPRIFAQPMYQHPGRSALLGSWERRVPRSGGARGGAAGTWLLGGRWDGRGAGGDVAGAVTGRATATSRARPGTAGGLLGGRPPAPGVPAPALARLG